MNAARERLRRERERLEDLRRVLTDRGLGSAASREAELSPSDQHPADIATGVFEREKEISIIERIDSQLLDVDHAMRRIDAGTYGTCEACGRTIPPERLEALPAARFCIDDQVRVERTEVRLEQPARGRR